MRWTLTAGKFAVLANASVKQRRVDSWELSVAELDLPTHYVMRQTGAIPKYCRGAPRV